MLFPLLLTSLPCSFKFSMLLSLVLPLRGQVLIATTKHTVTVLPTLVSHLFAVRDDRRLVGC